MATWGGQGRKIAQLFEGSAGRAVATGGFWSLTGTGKSLTMHLERPAPRRGAADFKGSALPADPLNLWNGAERKPQGDQDASNN